MLQPISVATGLRLRPLACWNCGLEWLGGMFFVRYRSLRRADHSSRGVLPSEVCLSMNVEPRHRGRSGALGAVWLWVKGRILWNNTCQLRKMVFFLIFLSERTQNNFAETYDSRLCVGRLTFPYTKAHSALRY